MSCRPENQGKGQQTTRYLLLSKGQSTYSDMDNKFKYRASLTYGAALRDMTFSLMKCGSKIHLGLRSCLVFLRENSHFYSSAITQEKDTIIGW